MGVKFKTNLAVNIDKYLGKARGRVHLVGIELEGGWEVLPKGINLIRDGSVVVVAPEERAATLMERQATQIENLYYTAKTRKALHIGELPSDPMVVTKFPIWMKAYYPSHVNETCGLHVHMSFKTALAYQRLMTVAYPATILAYVTKWANKEGLDDKHPIWDRLKGGSTYCQHIFDADMQVRNTAKDHDQRRAGHRYTVINYCYGVHSTAECRLLPMMSTCDQGVRAVQAVIDITNAFLVATAKREEKISGGFTIEEDYVWKEMKREYV